MESENGSLDMMDITAQGFGWIVDSAIRSETGSNLGESRVHSFTSVVDNAIRSEAASLLGTSPVPGFVSTDDNSESAIPPPLFSPPQIQPATNNFSRDNNDGARNLNIVNTGKRNSGGVAARLFAAPAIALANWRRRKNMAHYSDVPVEAEEDRGVDLDQFQRFSLRELQVATDNFSKKLILGRGGFENVYKGRLEDGSLIAVKRYKVGGSQDRELQFKIELEIMGKAVHCNLLRLRGFCMTPTERLLIYPFMVNGSVASHLRGRQEYQPPLSWSERKRIALGSARGLAYLHDHCDPTIIHRDVKAANILLDENFEALIGNFGFATLMDPKEDTYVTTGVRGIIGYIAPEYLSIGKCSEKSDVFGYGITLLELISGQKKFDLVQFANNNDIMLFDWVKGLLRERKLKTLVDADLWRYYNEKEVEELIQLALLCTQYSPTERPTMSEVVRMLEGDGLDEKWEQWQIYDTFLQDIKNNIDHLNANRLIHSSSDIKATELSCSI